MAKSRRKKAKPRKASALFTRMARESQSEPAGMLPPMSEVLMEFAQPLTSGLDPDAGEDAWRSRLMFAAIVWDRCVLAERQAAGREAPTELPAFDWQKPLAHLEQPEVAIAAIEQMEQRLVRRKRRLFPDDQRVIVDVLVRDAGDQLRISAISHVTEEQMQAGLVPGKVLGRAAHLWQRMANFVTGK